MLNSFDVAYNANALVSAVTSNDGKASYSYDTRNQRRSVTYRPGNAGGNVCLRQGRQPNFFATSEWVGDLD